MTYQERAKEICKNCDQSEVCGYYLSDTRHFCNDLESIMIGWTLGQQDTLKVIEDYADQGNTAWTEDFMEDIKQVIYENNVT